MPEMHENAGNTLCINEYFGRFRQKITAESRDNDLISGYIGRSKDDISKPAKAVSISLNETRFAPFL